MESIGHGQRIRPLGWAATACKKMHARFTAVASGDLCYKPGKGATRCPQGCPMTVFRRVELFTDPEGLARFREDDLPLDEGSPAARLSSLMPVSGLQLRQSPVGFRSEFHCTGAPQWLFVLRGCMEIGLRDGTTRRFGPGEHFFSNDTLPPGATFDPAVHGHCSRQVGDEPLVTAFVRV